MTDTSDDSRCPCDKGRTSSTPVHAHVHTHAYYIYSNHLMIDTFDNDAPVTKVEPLPHVYT